MNQYSKYFFLGAVFLAGASYCNDVSAQTWRSDCDNQQGEWIVNANARPAVEFYPADDGSVSARELFERTLARMKPVMAGYRPTDRNPRITKSIVGGSDQEPTVRFDIHFHNDFPPIDLNGAIVAPVTSCSLADLRGLPADERANCNGYRIIVDMRRADGFLSDVVRATAFDLCATEDSRGVLVVTGQARVLKGANYDRQEWGRGIGNEVSPVMRRQIHAIMESFHRVYNQVKRQAEGGSRRR